MLKFKKQSRREFIKVCSLSAGGLFLAAYVPIGCTDSEQDYDPNILSPSAYIRIDSNGVVTVLFTELKWGRVFRPRLPMIVAEELEVNWKDIRVEQADADKKYGEADDYRQQKHHIII
jgi:isoquinoline 1-oxidoreductase subunit beta